VFTASILFFVKVSFAASQQRKQPHNIFFEAKAKGLPGSPII
jgi:hypothetical protein